jgi:DNA-directed RNA polymerase
MDFRGRIYRSGILHFHERDLARSFIVFANNHQEGSNQSAKDIVASSAAFKYKKFYLYDDALQWYKEKKSLIYASDESLISFAKGASDPFQFIAKVLCYDRVQEYNRVPITQDAAASAYQIMSYLLLNEEMARRTNLIPNPDGKIQDVYMYLHHDLKVFLNHRIHDKLQMEIIESKLDRKLIKSLFMPLIYGKTLISMDKDLSLKYGKLLSRKDSYNLAILCNEFWNEKYPDIVNFMKLISIISWFCSVMDKAVAYSIPYFTTKQDSMSFIKEDITVYERATKKRRRVTLSVPTTKRDKRKTQSSACANFIHQKDAYIAMKVVESLLIQGASIYTVHENFITTPHYVKLVPDIYTKVFIKMGPPLKIINEFIVQNLIKPDYSTQGIFYDDPIPSDYLYEILNSLSPTKDKKKWERKVSDFLKYYNNYVDAVCCNQKKVIDSEKWENKKKLLENRCHNYSVHY